MPNLRLPITALLVSAIVDGGPAFAAPAPSTDRYCRYFLKTMTEERVQELTGELAHLLAPTSGSEKILDRLQHSERILSPLRMLFAHHGVSVTEISRTMTIARKQRSAPAFRIEAKADGHDLNQFAHSMREKWGVDIQYDPFLLMRIGANAFFDPRAKRIGLSHLSVFRGRLTESDLHEVIHATTHTTIGLVRPRFYAAKVALVPGADIVQRVASGRSSYGRGFSWDEVKAYAYSAYLHTLELRDLYRSLPAETREANAALRAKLSDLYHSLTLAEEMSKVVLEMTERLLADPDGLARLKPQPMPNGQRAYTLFLPSFSDAANIGKPAQMHANQVRLDVLADALPERMGLGEWMRANQVLTGRTRALAREAIGAINDTFGIAQVEKTDFERLFKAAPEVWSEIRRQSGLL